MLLYKRKKEKKKGMEICNITIPTNKQTKRSALKNEKRKKK